MTEIRKVDAKFVGNIRSINDRTDLTLVTDSQDVQAIKEHFGNPEVLNDFDGCFVKVEDGEYAEVLCFEGIVPELDKSLYEIVVESSMVEKHDFSDEQIPMELR